MDGLLLNITTTPPPARKPVAAKRGTRGGRGRGTATAAAQRPRTAGAVPKRQPRAASAPAAATVAAPPAATEVKEAVAAPVVPATAAPAVTRKPGRGEARAPPTKAAAPAASAATPAKPHGTRANPAPAPSELHFQRLEANPKPLRLLTSEESKHHLTASAFGELGLAAPLVEVLTSKDHMNFAHPTHVQRAALPALLAGEDVLVKSETGSGKTLTYLLPIVQGLQLAEPRVGRQEGTFAIVMAPTRELCQQIYGVLQKLLRPFHWLVPTLVTGGEKRKSEKARLRKGATVVVGTPGRLLDHMLHTQSFDFSRVRWLVLDEADRLLDLGFEQQITQVLERLQQVRDQADTAPPPSRLPPCKSPRGWQTALLSATLGERLTSLAALSLDQALLVNADELAASLPAAAPGAAASATDAAAGSFVTPRQLKQHYVKVEASLRLTTLCAFLRRQQRTGVRSKVIVFVSTCDAVDFLAHLLRVAQWPAPAAVRTAGSTAAPAAAAAMAAQWRGKRGAAAAADGAAALAAAESAAAAVDAASFPATPPPNALLDGDVFRLHGNVPQAERSQTFRRFAAAAKAVLVCTDVAARGLDLPHVDWIVQYDPPSETAEYVHRVGRTARSGHRGHALLFLLPLEMPYLDILRARGLPLSEVDASGVLNALRKEATSAKGVLPPVAAAAAELQHAVTRVVEEDPTLKQRARSAYLGHLRAYATHSKDTKHIFHVRSLHLGHVAKSFALKEPPRAMSGAAKKHNAQGQARGGRHGEDGEAHNRPRKSAAPKRVRMPGGAVGEEAELAFNRKRKTNGGEGEERRSMPKRARLNGPSAMDEFAE